VQLKNLIIAGCFLLTSCYRDEVVMLPEESEARIPVVLCFITLSDTLTASVFETTPFGKQANSVTAIITLSDTLGHEIIFEPNNKIKSNYTAILKTWKIIAGETYFLKVVFNDGRILNANTTVPSSKILIKDFKYLGKTVDFQNTQEYQFLFSWNKLPSQNFLLAQTDSSFYNNDTIISNIISTRNNITKTDSITYKYNYASMRNSFVFWLLTINEPFAKYIKSYDYFSNINDDLSSQSLFDIYRGVIPEYTNITGGIGAFGAYLCDKKNCNGQ
jgi:hypothetical protein